MSMVEDSQLEAALAEVLTRLPGANQSVCVKGCSEILGLELRTDLFRERVSHMSDIVVLESARETGGAIRTHWLVSQLAERLGVEAKEVWLGVTRVRQAQRAESRAVSNANLRRGKEEA